MPRSGLRDGRLLGWAEFSQLQWVNLGTMSGQTYRCIDCSKNFQQFINALSEQLGETVAVIQMDRAPAHRAQVIDWPENIIPIFQPAHCPELNPIERLWQFIKTLWKNENFASLDALRVRVHQQLNQLSVQQVQSLTSFDFILDALLQAAFQSAILFCLRSFQIGMSR